MGDVMAPGTVEGSWELCYIWQSLDGTSRLEFTYAKVESETAAIDAAVRSIDRPGGNPRLRLVEVHRREVGTDWWQRIDDS